ncbi:MAG: glycerate kinase type-2 family protein [Chloroflexota bacterium]
MDRATKHRLIQAVQAAALAAVEPGAAVRRFVQRRGDLLLVDGRRYDLTAFDRVWLVGGGKAGAPMTAALWQLLGERIVGGSVNVKYHHLLPPGQPVGPVTLVEAGHPTPDESGQAGAGHIAHLLSGLTSRDLVLVVISGGGSALLPLPAEGLSLADKQTITGALLRCGATIGELNAVRKHLSALKGGQLARLAQPASVIALVLSDVVGNPLDVIASGPTAPDASTHADAWKVLHKYNLLDGAPANVVARLRAGMAGDIAETPKPGDPVFERVQTVVVGSNEIAAQAAVDRARTLGLNSLLLSTFIEGEARQVARVLAGIGKGMARHGWPIAPPACLVAGGETTVTVSGSGRGGRNQELALAAALAIQGWHDLCLVSLATDGTDGPTDAAGAAAWGDTVARACALGLDAEAALANNDSYPFWKTLGDAIVTGPTNTNVNDLMLIFAF